MSLDQTARVFNNFVKNILDLNLEITQEVVENASNLFKRFSTFVYDTEYDITFFLNCTVKYFVLINRYGEQYKEVSPLQRLTIRMALGEYLFVLDETYLYCKIIRKFRKIIDVIVETKPSSNIKEFLRIYSQLLDKIPLNVLKQLAINHKSFQTLCNTIKEASDIELQAVAIEVIIKLFKHGPGINLNKNFLKIMQTINITTVDKSNMYQNIRMILDELNELSTKIFSINCKMIKVDSHQVIEFWDAGNNDIWLDFNMLERKMSFFCDQTYAAQIDDLRVYTNVSTWEVISFSVKDIVRKRFEYDRVTDMLNITLLLYTSSLSLFPTSKSSQIRKLAISIARNSGKFDSLVQEVLPSIFENAFTPDLVKKENESDGSSPIIEHFLMRKKVSSVKGAIDEHETSVVILDDSDDVLVVNEQTKGNISKKQNVSGITLSSDNCSEHSEIYNNNDLVISRRKTKTCVRTSSRRGSFNISTSPLSFTESVIGGRRKSPKERSFVKECTKISRSRSRSKSPLTKSKIKISSRVTISYKEVNTGKDTFNPDRFDQETILENVFDKNITRTDLNQSIDKVPLCFDKVVEIPELPQIEDLTDEIPPDQVKENSTFNNIENDEIMLDAQRFEIDESVLNRSISKVEEWLTKVDPKVSPANESPKRITESFNIQEEPLSDFMPSISARNTDRSLFIEERIERMMNGDKKTIEKSNVENPEVNSKADRGGNQPNTVEGLLKILCSQETVSEPTDKKVKSDLPGNVDLKKRLEASEINTSGKSMSLSVNKSPTTSKQMKTTGIENRETVKLNGNSANTSQVEKITVKESSVMEDAVNNEMQVDPDVTPDIDDLMKILDAKEKPLRKKRRNDVNSSKKKILNEKTKKRPKKEQKTKPPTTKHHKENINNTSVISNAPIKRKLYNPGDFSYLSNIINEEYLESRENDQNTSMLKTESIQTFSRSTKHTSKPSKKTQKTETAKKEMNLEMSTKLKKNNLLTRSTGKRDKSIPWTFQQIHNDLKKRLRKAKNKAKKNLTLKNRFISSSSSSSMEPFGVAVRKALEKTKSFASKERLKTLAKTKASTFTGKEQAQKTTKLTNELEENINTDISTKKINIISNILIKPGHAHPPEQKQCLDKLVNAINKSYLQYITQVRVCSPNLLVNEDCGAIIRVLQECANQH